MTAKFTPSVERSTRNPPSSPALSVQDRAIVVGAVAKATKADGAAGGVEAGPALESKNNPLTTALPQPVLVMRICTCPRRFQARYVPPEKLERLRASSTTPEAASMIS